MTTYINLDTPITETVTKTYTKFLIKNVTVNVNSNATIIILLCPIEGDIISRIIEMDGNDYTDWGSDDNYLIQFIKQKLLTWKIISILFLISIKNDIKNRSRFQYHSLQILRMIITENEIKQNKTWNIYNKILLY